MTEPRRRLGDYKRLIAPFNQSFRQGLAEIPQNLDRSQQSISRVQLVSRAGESTIDGFVCDSGSAVETVKTSAGMIRRQSRLQRLGYHFTLFKETAVWLFYSARLFWRKYRFVLLISAALGLSAWLVSTYVPPLWQQLVGWYDSVNWGVDVVNQGSVGGAPMADLNGGVQTHVDQ